MRPVFLTIAVTMTISAIQFVLWPAMMRGVENRGIRHPGAMFSMLLIPVIAFSVYATTGSPRAMDAASTAAIPQVRQPIMVSPGNSSNGVASIASLVDGLVERLANEPNDAQGWLLLAKSYKHLNRPDDFAMTYARARELGQSEPALDDYFNKASAEHQRADVDEARRDDRTADRSPETSGSRT